MSKARVSVVKVDEYDCARVRAAITKGIDLLGGLADIVKPGNRVLIKINHLSPASPAERGIVTHPIFLEAVLDMLKGTGASFIVGDDIDSDVRDGFQVSGIRQVCDRAGVTLVNLRNNGFVETGCQGLLLDKVYLSKVALDADLIINLPKLKTHSLTILTGGVKNMYGTIPQGVRTGFHYKYIRVEDFGQMLTDVFSAIRPVLTIMDGVVAMEGEGPACGELRRLGVILASRDAVALDAVASKIIGLNPMDIYTTRYSDERGLGIGHIDNIEVVGERIEDVAVDDYKLPLSYARVIMKWLPGFLARFLSTQMSTRPQVIERLCTGCLECNKVCPTGAATSEGVIAKISWDICIRCMCCHEACRFAAIVPTQPITGRALSFIAYLIRRLREGNETI